MSGRPVRVLISGIVLDQPASGVRRFAEQVFPRVARRLGESGGSMSVLEPASGLPWLTGAGLERLPSRVDGRLRFGRSRDERRALLDVLAQARSEGRPFDLCLLGHLPAPDLGAMPTVQLVHDVRITTRFAPAWKRWVGARVLREAVRRASTVVTVSEAMSDALRQRFGVEPRVIGHGGDHLPLAESRTRRGVLSVGHLEPRKNVELLLDAWRRDPSLPALSLVGRGPLEVKLKRMVSDAGLAERVHFLGAVSDERLAELYGGTRVVVLPSRYEGFGIGLLEARRAGAALAVSAIPAHLERSTEHDARFDPEDPEQATLAIRTALERTHEPPRDVPSWEHTAEHWTALFERVADRVR